MTLALAAPGVVEIQKKEDTKVQVEKPAVEAPESLPAQAGAALSLLEAPQAPPSSLLPPVLEYIAWCESGNRHFDERGRVLRGKGNYYDIGKYQINAIYWGEKAKKLGFDLHTEEGNEAMALLLYQRYGTDPWKWSRSCWSRPLLTRAK